MSSPKSPHKDTIKSNRTFNVRTALPKDLPQIHAINAHYVHTSVATFMTHPPPPSAFEEKLQTLVANGFPFLVIKPDSDSPAVLGYAYASQFRSEKGAYAQTAEITIYIEPSQRKSGVGRALLAELLRSLKASRVGVREVLAAVAVDEVGEGRGVERFYEGFGFEDVGVLKGVGRKFGRWIDVRFMQLRWNNREEAEGK